MSDRHSCTGFFLIISYTSTRLHSIVIKLTYCINIGNYLYNWFSMMFAEFNNLVCVYWYSYFLCDNVKDGYRWKEAADIDCEWYIFLRGLLLLKC